MEMRRERRYIFKICPSLNNLVDNVRFGESWVVLDDGFDSLADSWGRWNYGSWGSGNYGSSWGSIGSGSNWGSSIGSGSIWVSSISESSGVWVSSGIWVSSISKSSKTSIAESSVWKSSWEYFSGSWGGSLFTGSGFFESSLEFSLGSSYFWGILNWFWEGVFVDWGNTFENWGNWESVFMDWLSKISNWGNWQVGSLDTEAKTISNVVDGLDKSVGIGVAVRSGYSTIGVSGFLLSRVRVGVSVSEVSEFILRLELAGLWESWGSNQSGGGYWGGNSNWGSSDSWGSSDYFGISGLDGSWEESSSIWVSTGKWVSGVSGIAESSNSGVWGDDLGAGTSQYAQYSDESLHFDLVVV